MDGSNFGNNDQNTQSNLGNNGYQNAGGTNNQYGSNQNDQNADSQYGGYQNNQGAGGQSYQNNQNGQYGYQNAQNGQYGNYQNNQNVNGQYGGYQNNMGQMPPYPAPIVNNSVGNRANGLQVAGLICGILAICACWCYGVVSIVLGIAGLICSIAGNSRGKHGVGIGGLVCSIIGLVLGVASLIYYIWAFQYLSDIGYFDAIMQEFYR